MDLYLDALDSPVDPATLFQDVISRLEKLWSILGDLMLSSSSRKEAKALLVSTISRMDSLSVGIKLDAFIPMMTEAEAGAMEALMRLVCEKDAQRAAQYLARYQPAVFRSFFLTGSGSRQRILSWFSGIAMSGLKDFSQGSKALCRFALKERERVWDKLVWAGKHAQAPAVVAAKTHYFQELDLVPSVTSILSDDRLSNELLKSEPWLESISDGSILDIDMGFFVKELSRQASFESREITSHLASIIKGDRDRVARAPKDDRIRHLIASCLTEDSNWASVCRRLLQYLPDGKVLALLSHHGSSSAHRSLPSSLIFESHGHLLTMNDALTLNLLTCNQRDLNAMVSSASFSAQDRVNQTVRSLHAQDLSSSHRSLLHQVREAKSEGRPVPGSSLSPSSILALEAWSLMYRMKDLSNEDLTRTALSSGLMVEEATRSGKSYSLLKSDDEGGKKKKRKKRRLMEEEEEEEGVCQDEPIVSLWWVVDEGLILNKIDLIERVVSITCQRWLQL